MRHRFNKVILPALVAILAAVILFTDTLAGEVEIGGSFLSGDFAEGGAVIVSERFNDRWDLSMGYISEQFVNTCGRPDCAFEIRENLFVGGQRLYGWNRFKFGLGVAVFQNDNRALGCKFNASVSLEYRFLDRLVARLRHFSNAGSCAPNLGQDLATIAWRFD